jgi:hypothetical protein
MSEFRFELEKGGVKHPCPACKKMRFVPYVDTFTGKPVAYVVGRCDREDKCGYHLIPSEYYKQEGTRPTDTPTPHKKREPVPEQEPSFIDTSLMQASLSNYNKNNLCRWLCSVFGERKAFGLTMAYQVGTSKHWSGSCVFWQIDKDGRIRRGKVMLYDNSTGRRVKEPFNHITTAHSLLRLPLPQPEQCLFGEHLLSVDQVRPVAVVESEKTAIVAAGFLPEFLWLATAGKNNLSREKLKVVQGRRVVLYPDLGAYEKWREIVKGMPSVSVSDILERRASEADRVEGLDIADYLLRESAVEAQP